MFKVPGQSRKNIRDLVRVLRKIMGISADKPVDVCRLLEHVLPSIIEGFNYEVLEEFEMGDEHGRTYPKKKLIHIRKDVYDGAVRGEGRDRMTILHEIGHLFLHSGVTLSYARFENIKTYENPEWQANCFAGEFLMPYEKIINMGVDEIARKYKVSKEAARTQKRSI